MGDAEGPPEAPDNSELPSLEQNGAAAVEVSKRQKALKN